MSLIMTTSELERALQEMENVDSFVTIDTEFLRETTYWPQLCLIQLGGSQQTLLIDALSPELSLECLFNFLKKDHILKIFHAARQDLEIFYRLMGDVPQALFDTQIAAMACGYGDQVGYESLVAHIVRKPLDKTQQYSNWDQRPLSSRQIAYAMADVIYLRDIYLKLSAQLKETQRDLWIEEETNHLKSLKIYQIDPDSMWKKLRLKNTQPQFLARLKSLAAFREQEAMAQNLPRGRIIRDDFLTEIAYHNPLTVHDFNQIRGLPKDFGVGKLGQRMLILMNKANALPSEQCPVVDTSFKIRNIPSLHVDFLRFFLKIQADYHKVAERLIATTKSLEEFLCLENQQSEHPLLHGWRYEVFGQEAWALKEGKSGLRITKDRIQTF